MAKEKSKPTVNDLLGSVISAVSTANTKGQGGGVELRTYAERWLFDANVIRSGEIYYLPGEPAAGKSQFAALLAAMFVRAGGAAEIIDTEHKSNASASIIPLVGEDIYFSGRFGVSTAGTIDVLEAAKKGSEEAQEEHQKSWMQMVKRRIEAIKSHPELRDIPVLLVVDSLCGATSAESRGKYEESEGSVGGKSFAGASRAAALTNWFPAVTTDIADTKITLAFTNHVKIKINPNRPAYLPPEISFPGGEAPRFHSSTTLLFKKGGKVSKASVGGRSVRIKVNKNSFGDDERSLDVTFYYDMLKDANGDVVRDEHGNPMRRLKWDWDEATATLFKKMLLSKEGGLKTVSNAAFPGLTMTKGLVQCKKLGIADMTMTEFGRHVIRDEEIYQKLMEIPRMSINHAPPHLVIKPDWSDLEEPSLIEGEWQAEPDDDDDEFGELDTDKV